MRKPVSAPSHEIKMTAFTVKVMKLVRSIPRGRVASYGQIAALAGKPHGARGVGWILNSSSKAHKLPWQRVVNSKGKISFPKKTEEYREQKKLLVREKVRFADDDSIPFAVFGWKKTAAKPRAKRLEPRMFR